MSIILYGLLGISIYLIVGAGVWAAIDDDAQSFYHWYKSAPQRLAWLAQPIVLCAWPIALWLRYRRKI